MTFRPHVPVEEQLDTLRTTFDAYARLLDAATNRAMVAKSRWANLRAKIEALPRCDVPIEYDDGKEHEFSDGRMLNRADVLALLEGETQ